MKRIGFIDGIETIQNIEPLYTDPKHWWNDFSVWQPYFHETDYHYLIRLTYYEDGLTFHRYETATWCKFNKKWLPIPLLNSEEHNDYINWARFDKREWRII